MVQACRLHSLESCPAPGHAPVSSPSRVPEAGEVEQVRLRVCRPGEAAGQQSVELETKAIEKAPTRAFS